MSLRGSKMFKFAKRVINNVCHTLSVYPNKEKNPFLLRKGKTSNYLN